MEEIKNEQCTGDSSNSTYDKVVLKAGPIDAVFKIVPKTGKDDLSNLCVNTFKRSKTSKSWYCWCDQSKCCIFNPMWWCPARWYDTGLPYVYTHLDATLSLAFANNDIDKCEVRRASSPRIGGVFLCSCAPENCPRSLESLVQGRGGAAFE